MKIFKFIFVKSSTVLIGLLLLQGQLMAQDLTEKRIAIKCEGPEPVSIKVVHGDKVEFDNQIAGMKVKIVFTQPGVFNPSPVDSTIDVPENGSETLTVGNIDKGTGYSYDCENAKGFFEARTGRIDPK